MALAVAAEALAGTVALKGARAGVLVLLVKVAAAALADTAAVPARMRAISIGISWAFRTLTRPLCRPFSNLARASRHGCPRLAGHPIGFGVRACHASLIF